MLHEDCGVVDVEKMGVSLDGFFSVLGLSKIDSCIVINVDVFCKGNVVMVGWVLVERDGFFAFSDNDVDVFKRDMGVFGTIDKGGYGRLVECFACIDDDGDVYVLHVLHVLHVGFGFGFGLYKHFNELLFILFSGFGFWFENKKKVDIKHGNQKQKHKHK
jgi:hypothetical protein